MLTNTVLKIKSSLAQQSFTPDVYKLHFRKTQSGKRYTREGSEGFGGGAVGGGSVGAAHAPGAVKIIKS